MFHRRPKLRLMASGFFLTAVLTGCTAASTVADGSSGTTARSTAPPTTTATSAPGTTAPTVTSRTTTAHSTAPRATRSASRTTVTSTVTRTRPGRTIIATAPPSTSEPAATPGDCPYLDADVVSDITGQHHGQTQIVDLQPHPMCVFYRSDGGLMGSVRIIEAPTPQGAAAAVDQRVPVAGSQPASQPAGWTGGSMTTPGQMTQDSSAGSTYAVSKGSIAVVATENESPSIKARVMAVCAIYGLELEPGPAPDYCNGAQG